MSDAPQREHCLRGDLDSLLFVTLSVLDSILNYVLQRKGRRVPLRQSVVPTVSTDFGTARLNEETSAVLLI